MVGPEAVPPETPPAAVPPRGPARFVLAADPGGSSVPIGVAIGLAFAGLATGFLVALGATGKLGKQS
jgi:hypothetical protein